MGSGDWDADIFGARYSAFHAKYNWSSLFLTLVQLSVTFKILQKP